MFLAAGLAQPRSRLKLLKMLDQQQSGGLEAGVHFDPPNVHVLANCGRQVSDQNQARHYYGQRTDYRR